MKSASERMMKKFVKFFSPLVICAVSACASASTYKITDIDQLEKTNACTPNCDFSGVTWAARTSLTANHSGADLKVANFSNADISGINLSGAHLEGANLSGLRAGDFPDHISNFSQAFLTGAHFQGADLRWANLFAATGFDPTGANVCNATLPDGSIGKCD